MMDGKQNITIVTRAVCNLDSVERLILSSSQLFLKGTGNAVPPGTYYYIFDFTFIDKTQKQVKGYFELLR